MSNTKSSVLDFDSGEVLSKVPISAKITKHTTMPIDKLFLKMAEPSFFDTSILPIGDETGLLMLRGGLDHLQIVYQVAPGVYPEIWGRSEGDQTAAYAMLAQPYKLIIGDFIAGSFIGARHFYSPVPFRTLDTPLFHVALPNTNCKGYRGTSVGWMCLYRNGDQTKMTIAQKIAYVFQRASGSEAYNDANMSSTDGPRYYKSQNMPQEVWDRDAWIAKTKAEGFEWRLDPKLFLPVLVPNIDEQSSGNSGKHHLTVGDAINGTYNAYYPTAPPIDRYPLKPIGAYTRGLTDKLVPMVNMWRDHIRAYIQSNSTETAAPVGAENLSAAIAAAGALTVSLEPYEPSFQCKGCGLWTKDELGVTLVGDIDEYVNVCPTCAAKPEVAVQVDRFFFDANVTERGTSFLHMLAEKTTTRFLGTASHSGVPYPVWAINEKCPNCSRPFLPTDVCAARPYLDNRVWGASGLVQGCTSCSHGAVWCEPLNRFLFSAGDHNSPWFTMRTKTEVPAYQAMEGWNSQVNFGTNCYVFSAVPPDYLVENGGFVATCACDKMVNSNKCDIIDGKNVCVTCIGANGEYAPVAQAIEQAAVQVTKPAKKKKEPAATESSV